MKKQILSIAVIMVLLFVTACSDGGSKSKSDIDQNPDSIVDDDVLADDDAEELEDKEVNDEDSTEVTSEIVIKNSDVRGCDILLETTSASIDGVSFSDKVKGEWGKRGPKFALSFINTKDEAFEEIGELKISQTGSISLKKAVCYDKSGKAVENAELTIEGVE